jgi:hypothetical protein
MIYTDGNMAGNFVKKSHFPNLLLEKLTVTQLVKKFPAFYGTPKVHIV